MVVFDAPVKRLSAVIQLQPNDFNKIIWLQVNYSKHFIRIQPNEVPKILTLIMNLF